MCCSVLCASHWLLAAPLSSTTNVGQLQLRQSYLRWLWPMILVECHYDQSCTTLAAAMLLCMTLSAQSTSVRPTVAARKRWPGTLLHIECRSCSDVIMCDTVSAVLLTLAVLLDLHLARLVEVYNQTISDVLSQLVWLWIVITGW